MEKIYFDDTTFIWKKKLNLIQYKPLLLKEANVIMDSQPMSKQDGFGIINWVDSINSLEKLTENNRVTEVSRIAVNECKKIYEDTTISFNKVNIETWINRVRCKNPIQIEYWGDVDKYHTHTDISKKLKVFHPNFTFVYYIQMPDVMDGEDGVLYFKSKEGKEYYIRPEEDDLIIMEGDMPHSPNSSPNSTIDRIVLAGNVGFDFIKTKSSVI
jgi:hypothetical protein